MDLLTVNIAFSENPQQREAYHVLLFSAKFQILFLSDGLFVTSTYKNYQTSFSISLEETIFFYAYLHCSGTLMCLVSE